MHRQQFAFTLACTLVRNLSWSGSALGTEVGIPQGLLQTLQKELKEEEGRGKCGIGEKEIRDCISYGEMDHLESPEADEAHIRKVGLMMDDFFSKIPLPSNPMQAALAPTEEELRQKEGCEVLREVVREQYRRQQACKAAEEARIAASTRRYNSASIENVDSSGLGTEDDSDETEELRCRIENLKNEVASLEKLLKSRSRC